jgi:mevalonate kinase
VGSGADVAAAVYGGFIKFVRPVDGPPVIEPIPVPAGLHLVVFWTGESADTREAGGIRAGLRRMAPSSYRMLMGALRTTAERFVNELARVAPPAPWWPRAAMANNWPSWARPRV